MDIVTITSDTDTITVTGDEILVEVINDSVEIIEVALKGDAGLGVPIGGTSGQYLSKIDNSDFNTGWVSVVGVVDHTLLTNIGTNSHAQIDTHIADSTVHFTQAAISITESQISDLGSYEQANINIQSHIADNTTNPHSVTKTQVGLGNVDNTSDINKPLSSATQTALDSKEDGLSNPSTDGYVLSSTASGVRSWVVDANTDTTDHTLLTNIGTTSHTALDTHVNNTALKHPATAITFDDTIVNQGFIHVQETMDYFDDQIKIRDTAATAIDFGGDITLASLTTIDISAGEAHVIDGYTDRHNPTRTEVVWNAVTGYVITFPSPIGVQVVYVDQAGVIQQKTGRLTEQERRSFIQLAFVYHKDGSIRTVQPAGVFFNESSNVLYDWIYFTEQSNRVKGMGINPVDNLLQLWGETGEFISPGINTTNDLKSPNIGLFPAVGDNLTPLTFDVIYANGATQAAVQTTLPKYYESAPGVTTAITGNDAVIHYIYRTFSNEFLLQLGTTVYSDAKLARDSLEIDRNVFNVFTGSDNTLPSAQVYVGANANDFNNQNLSGIVSLIGAGSGASGGIAVTDFLSLTDVYETTYLSNAGKYLNVNSSETGLVYTDIDHDVNVLNVGTNTHTQIDTHIADNTTNPHSVTKTQVGLGNVDNTSDLNKPISTATQTALGTKANLLGRNVFQATTGSPIEEADQWYLGAANNFAREGTASIYGSLDKNANGEFRIHGDIAISLDTSAIIIPNFTGLDGSYLTIGSDGLITATSPVDPIVTQTDNNPGTVILPQNTPTDLGVSITKSGTSTSPTLEIAMTGINTNGCGGMGGGTPATITFRLWVNGIDVTNTPLTDEIPCNTSGGILLHAAIPYAGNINDTDVVTVQATSDQNNVSVSNITFKISVSGTSVTAQWGSITGTLSNQTDLQNVLDGKLDLTGGNITGAVFYVGNTPQQYFVESDAPLDEKRYRWRTNNGDFLWEIVNDAGSLASTFLAVRRNGYDTTSIDFLTAPVTSDTTPTAVNHLTRKDYVDTKEVALGNPATDGFVLSSTAAGVRTWVDNDPVYAQLVDDLNTTFYIGEAAVGSLSSASVWRIKKLVVAGSTVTTTWASGDANFDKIYDNRTGYIYS